MIKKRVLIVGNEPCGEKSKHAPARLLGKLVFASLIIFTVTYGVDRVVLDADSYYLDAYKDESLLFQAKNIYEDALLENPDDADIMWRLSRVNLMFGDKQVEKKAKRSYYELGLEYAEKAKLTSPRNANAHYWYAVSLERIASTKGALTSGGSSEEIRQSYEIALVNDSQHAGAYYGLGKWYRDASVLAGRSYEKSIDYFNKAIFFDPNYTAPYVGLAATYVQMKDYETARSFLTKCLEVAEPTYPVEFYKYDKNDALMLLLTIENK